MTQRNKYPTALALGLCLLYIIAGKCGLQLAHANPSVSAVWPASGIALAALLAFGYQLWPGIFLGAFLVNLTTAGTVSTSLGIAVGNTLEAVLGCYLVTRFAGGRHCFARAPNVFRFAAWALVSTTVSATIGMGTLVLYGIAPWQGARALWSTWWLGDGVGDLLAAPLLLLWLANPTVNWTRKKALEGAFLASTLGATAWSIFGGGLHPEIRNYPLEFLCIPSLIWAGFRFGSRGAAAATVAFSGVAIWGTMHGFGPFVVESQQASLLLLQTFIGIMSVTTLAVGAEVSERQRAEEQIRELATLDPLTGLANYRHLMEVLDGEMRRSCRAERQFAIVLLDLDGLKKINDTCGHITGSRALCRLAHVLRTHSRDVDTAARYGGDEFVLMLPETAESEAHEVAARIAERLAQDAEEPAITVSVGTAVWPQDAMTITELLEAADANLYRAKREKHYSVRATAQGDRTQIRPQSKKWSWELHSVQAGQD
ncbi:MAG: diguanylate cyclase [Acidipila sp.]|nr:diguanylate cyclase [Acidipila sp.]